MHSIVEPISNNMMNGDSIKITSHNKPYEKRMQNLTIPNNKPSIHPMVDVTSTVIVNNSKMEPPSTHNEENLTAINSNFNNKNFDFKIEHIVSTSKEEYKGITEKNDIPYVIKSSIEVKQNGNDNKEKDENTSNAKAPITNVATKPDVTIIEEAVPKKEVKEEPPVIEKVVEVAEAPQITAPRAENKSWASVLKRQNNSEPHNEVTTKPTAVIVPNVIVNASNEKNEQPAEKPVQSAPKIHQSKPSSENNCNKNDELSKQKKPLHTEISQRYCDDPITYRMGG